MSRQDDDQARAPHSTWAARLSALKRVIALWTVAGLIFATIERIAESQSEGSEKSGKVDWSVFLPEGEGKAEVVVACSTCHDLRQVITQKKTIANWNATVRKMVSAFQAPVDKEDLQTIVGYLSKNFGEKNPIEELPMNVNTSSVEALARLPGIGPEAAKAIVAARKSNGPFASTDDLLRVEGMDSARLNKIKPYIKTKD